MRLTEEEKQKVEDNIKLVYSFYHCFIANKKDVQPFSEDEIKSELFLALCKAIKSFDNNRKIKFSTYVYASFHNTFVEYNNKCIKHNQKFLCVGDIEKHIDLYSVSPEIVNWNEIECVFNKKQANLTIKEKKILRRHYKKNLPFTIICREFTLSRERVRQIAKEAIGKIGRYIKKTNYEIKDFYNINYR